MEEAVRAQAGLKKTEEAALVGKLIAQRALERQIKRAVFDRAGYRYHGRVKAVADGAREGGLEF
jgi:large subunit ribosomal protein L18